ncbi:MAG TPA: DUF6261 family protein [Bacteroides togonis]|nr:DUF6261 family protein [Bacteroides togonis]
MTDIPTGRTGIRTVRRKVRRKVQTLGETFGKSDRLSQRSEKLSESPTGCPNAWRSFRKVRRSIPTLGKAFGKSDGLPQHLEKLSESPTERPNAWRSFRKVRRSVPTLGEAFGRSDGASQRSEKLSESPTGRQNVRRDFRTFRRKKQDEKPIKNYLLTLKTSTIMQIITSQVPYTSKARNAEHDYLFNKLVEAISKEFATKHNFLAYHQRMTAALADENASYTRTTKYVDTDTLVQKDNARDNLFRRLKLHLQSAELDPDADVAAAAARCLEALGSQNPTTLPYTENTAAVRDIVDKLESDHYAPSVEQVGAAQLVADLKAANNDFDALYTARADERYARNTSAPDMKVARAAMEAAYADVADIVNALYIQSTVLAPDEETLAEVTAIATTVNALISQYTLVLSRRGVGKTTDDTTDTDTPDEGGTDTPQPEPEEPGGDEGEGGSPL